MATPTASPVDPSPRPGLRTRRRLELIEAVRTAALHQLREQGASGLSLRAIARDVDIAVSALYRYFPSRDDLVTDLLVRAFDGHADAVEAAAVAGTDVGDALRGALRAYRTWSLEHPAEFALAYGTPLPGYQAPPERTVAAGARVGDVLARLVARAGQEGRLDEAHLQRRAAALDPTTSAQLQDLIERRSYALPVEAMAAAMDVYVRWHGLVTMEVFGHLRPVTPDAESYAAGVLDLDVALLIRPAVQEARGTVSHR